MKRALLIFCFLWRASPLFAQQTAYTAGSISKELLPYANVVVRNDELSIDVKDIDNVTYHVKKAITVLNKNGDDEARIVIFYDKSISVKYVKGIVYDEFGKQLKKFSESNFADQSAANDFSLFEDSRIKHYLPAVTQYPYTIAYEYEVRMDQSLNFPEWSPSPSTNIAVENSSYTFTCKPDFNIRYKEINVPGKVNISTNSSGLKVYTWKAGNLKAYREEPYSPNRETYLTTVNIAPEKFEYENIKGAFNNWNELGKWYYDKLLSSRRNLPEQTVSYIRALVGGIDDPKLKAKKIYEYMQSRTHYISVQIGIGGYQPFYAFDVDKLGYGDCKALVNYTQALLKAVDIDSYYCVVYSGDRKRSLSPDFASMNQGDHVILCIPFKNDTTWLECTSQKIPFGFLDNFTDDRLVLACSAQGGKLMHTPKYTAQDNLETRIADFSISEKGELSGNMTSIYKGTRYNNHAYLIGESRQEQDKLLQKVYPIDNLTVKDFTIKENKSIMPSTIENLKFSASDYGTANDGKIYFVLNPVNRLIDAPREIRNRQREVYINDGFTTDDDITYALPAGYRLDKRPLDVAVEKPFGKYIAKISVKDGKLIYKRHLQIIDGTYTKESYDELVDFYADIYNADRFNVTLVKTTN